MLTESICSRWRDMENRLNVYDYLEKEDIKKLYNDYRKTLKTFFYL